MVSRSLIEVRAARKAQLIQKLGYRERALFDAELNVREALDNEAKENADVVELEESSAEHLLLSLTGQLEERVAEERRQAQVAQLLRLRYQAQRDRLLVEVTRVRSGIVALGHPEQALVPCTETATARRTEYLVVTMSALDEAYEAQDALILLRTGLARAVSASRRNPGADGPARTHARVLTTTALDRFGRFEDELAGLQQALISFGDGAPQASFPAPGHLHQQLLSVWRNHQSLDGMEPSWQRLQSQIAQVISELEADLHESLKAAPEVQWNVERLFLS